MPGGATAAGGGAAQAGNMNGHFTTNTAASAAASLATEQGVATPSMSGLKMFFGDAAVFRGSFSLAAIGAVLFIVWLWLP
jgi:hypothetical protein